MTITLYFLFIAVTVILITGISILKALLKGKRKSAETIYKLINDLEKKYIY